MLKICSLFALSLTLSFAAVSAGAQTVSGVVRVIDGDTFDLGGTRIRLHGIDALEASQTCETDDKKVAVKKKSRLVPGYLQTLPEQRLPECLPLINKESNLARR